MIVTYRTLGIKISSYRSDGVSIHLERGSSKMHEYSVGIYRYRSRGEKLVTGKAYTLNNQRPFNKRTIISPTLGTVSY